MSPPDVSVVITTCHRESLVLQAVESALGQVGVSLEVIVVDDGGGGARSAIESLTDPRVRYVQRATPSSGNPGAPRNDGAALARGQFLHFLDDDDRLESDSLLVLSQALQSKPLAGLAFGRIVPFGDDARVLRHQKRYFERVARKARSIRGRLRLTAHLLFRESLLVNSACMTRRELFQACGGYDTNIPVFEDVELWARVVRDTDFVYVDRPVLNYRTGAPSLMHNLKENDPKQRIAYVRMHEKYRHTHGLLEHSALRILSRIL